mmetsp:Transcript_16647/g.24854  ORF Transcript_16647/g.24854 Transcript_16647/m.24854 type:complete len:493 (+) Transcript_16647:32-1510(+)
MSSSSIPNQKVIFEFIEKKKDYYIQKLEESVAIRSVSSDPSLRDEVFAMAKYLTNWMEKIGFQVRTVDPGVQKGLALDGGDLPLPPILLGQYGQSKDKPTVCVYFHYDVQPANIADAGWAGRDPFKLINENGVLYGRGSTDDKGPGLGWLLLVEAYQELNIDFPVNLKLVTEGMEESGSINLDKVVDAESAANKGFFDNVDFFCISDNYWLGTTKPALTYGLRGMSYFALKVTSGTKDLHSGSFGGTIHESSVDLMRLMASLVDSHGRIQVDGILDQVATLTDEEKKLYDAIDFDVDEYTKNAGVSKVIHADDAEAKQKTLMARWRYPSLSLHGIEGAFSGPGAKTVIPCQVIGKFSLRLVPNQTPEEVHKLVKAHLDKVFATYNSPNTVELSLIHGARAWVSDPDHPNFVAGRKAIEMVWGVTPDFTREGGSIPITLTFQDACNCNVLLLPMGRADDGAHSAPEKLDTSNYIGGIKVFSAYLNYIVEQYKK